MAVLRKYILSVTLLFFAYFAYQNGISLSQRELTLLTDSSNATITHFAKTKYSSAFNTSVLHLTTTPSFTQLNNITHPNLTSNNSSKHVKTGSDCNITEVNSTATLHQQQWPEYQLTSEVKSWFGHKLTFPLTLTSDLLIAPCGLCPAHLQLDYLVMIHTAPSHTHRRQAIRDTFGHRSIFTHLHYRVLFLLGTTPDPDVTSQIKAEARDYNDIVQGPFVDSYRNLTLKGVMGFRWLAEHCPGVKLVVKLDDDVLLNVFKMVRYIIPTFSGKYRQIVCQATSGKIIRDESSGEYKLKWKVEADDFVGMNEYPFAHCNGHFVFITGDLIAPLLQAAKVNPVFWIDDIYLFGMLPRTVGDVTMTRLWRFVTFDLEYFTHCAMTRGLQCNSLIFNNNNRDREDNGHMYTLWAIMKRRATEWDRRQFQLHESF